MSVGHVARAFEEAGISTVALTAMPFHHVAERMNPPRVLITPHISGRTISAPGDVARQREVLLAAFMLLEEATEGGTLRTMEGKYRPGLVATRDR